LLYVNHSSRIATSGSIRIARRAGIHDARIMMIASNGGTVASVSASCAVSGGDAWPAVRNRAALDARPVKC